MELAFHKRHTPEQKWVKSKEKMSMRAKRQRAKHELRLLLHKPEEQRDYARIHELRFTISRSVPK